MRTALALQYAAIALAVAVSAVFVVRRQFPGAVRNLRRTLALWLLREGRAPWMHAFGRRIAPPARIAGSACGGCDGCESD